MKTPAPDTFPNAFEIPRGLPYWDSPDKPDSAPPPLTVAPPLGELGEEYYCKRDDFTRYIEESVNPERIRAGLLPIDIYVLPNSRRRTQVDHKAPLGAGGHHREISRRA